MIAEGTFAAAERFDSYRLPELFAGITREEGTFPVPYLGTNVPQAWAAAAVFRLVAILCGIHTNGRAKTIYVNPAMPWWLPNLTLRNLRAGKGAMDLHVQNDHVEVLSNTTGFEIVAGPGPAGPARGRPARSRLAFPPIGAQQRARAAHRHSRPAKSRPRGHRAAPAQRSR